MAGVDDAVAHDSAVAVDVVGHAGNFLVLFPRNVEPYRVGFENRRDETGS